MKCQANRSANYACSVKCSVQRTVWVVTDNGKVITGGIIACSGGNNLAVRLNRYRISIALKYAKWRENYAGAAK